MMGTAYWVSAFLLRKIASVLRNCCFMCSVPLANAVALFLSCLLLLVLTCILRQHFNISSMIWI